MSNKRHLPGTRAAATVHCAVCGKGIGKTSRRAGLGDGRSVCGRCVDDGVLLRKLDCGHMATAGNMVIRTGGGYTCGQCSHAEKMREST